MKYSLLDLLKLLKANGKKLLLIVDEAQILFVKESENVVFFDLLKSGFETNVKFVFAAYYGENIRRGGIGTPFQFVPEQLIDICDMLLSKEETKTLLNLNLVVENISEKAEMELVEYIYRATNGHIGLIRAILSLAKQEKWKRKRVRANTHHNYY